MNVNLKKYKVIPSVVEADKESVITIKSYDGRFGFYDDITYEVTFIPQDISDVPLDDDMRLQGHNKMRKTFLVKPQNGELKVKYYFKGEQEWQIHISCKEYGKYLNPLYEKYAPALNEFIKMPEYGVYLNVYSLYEDLYKRRALRGDLHIHTSASDGKETPEMVAAYYRKAGRDFIAVTDHIIYNASKTAKEKIGFIENFKIFHGEEVHNRYRGFLHMVNIGSDYSINDIFINEPERVERELKELESEIEIPEDLEKKEYLMRVWTYREIKKAGGYCIFVHPYWNIGYFHTSTPMSKAVVKNGLCDAFEIIGGCKPKDNNMQVALYNELRVEGYDVPVVGSTDSHTVLSDDHLLRSTIVFAEDGDILKAISDGYSVAVESLPGENKRVYGKLRLALYAHFLLNNYYPLHNELCSASGLFIEEYIKGNTCAKVMIENAENIVSAFEKEFFGI